MLSNTDPLHAAIVGIVRNLELVFQNDRLVLKGQCRSFFGKKLAQDTARAYLADTAIVNQIEVSEWAEPALT